MPPDAAADGYLIWGADRAIYGPVELPTLVTWIKDERVVADTWLFIERSNAWEQAARVPELQMFFHGGQPAGADESGTMTAGLSPGALRHVRLLAALNDGQLQRFLQAVEVQTVPAGTQVAKPGEPAQAMFLLVEGELRVRSKVDGVETNLGSLNAGEFFGEIALFDHGPRSAEVIAAQESTLLKLGAAGFEKLTQTAPDAAAPFLHALAKMFVSRIRAENKRYRDSICFIRPTGR